MWQVLRQWLTFPTFDDPEKNYRAKLLYAITLMLIILVSSNLVFLFVTSYLLADVLLSFGLLAVLVWCLSWTQQGYVQRASIILCFVLWLAVTANVHFYGPRDVIASGYILIIIIATLLLGGTGGLGAIMMSALALSTIALGRDEWFASLSPFGLFIISFADSYSDFPSSWFGHVWGQPSH